VIALRLTRSSGFYQIAPAYAGGDGYVGLRDGQVVARGPDRVAGAKALLAPADRAAGTVSAA
jgi:hypothetical protein